MRPLAIDLFCGLGGWTEGLLATGWDVVGFDMERHQYLMPEELEDGGGSKKTKPVEKRGWTAGTAITLGIEGASSRPRIRLAKYPAQLVLQDVLTLDGRQFKDAQLIVASPPCTEFSYMAMPWSRGKQIAAALRGDISPEGLPVPFPEEYEGSRNRHQLTALFDACFRIQREACAAAGHHIPMVVENVKGAQPWVGRANANYGSFYLWGDIATVNGNIIGLGRIGFDVPILQGPKRAAAKNGGGGSWFPVSHGKDTGEMYGTNPVRGAGIDGVKHGGDCFSDPTWPGRQGGSTKTVGHVKQPGLSGAAWFDQGAASVSSKSNARKAASAAIAKIPPDLAEYVGRFYFPGGLTPKTGIG